MSVQGHDEISELLGAYALDAVEPDERELVERHLEECPRCRAEVADHSAVAALLGNTGGDAPEGLWDRLAATLEEPPPPMRLTVAPGDEAVVPLAERRRSRRGRYAAPAAAAAAAVVIAALGVQVVRQEDEIDRISAALQDEDLLSAANLALVDPSAVQSVLTSPDGTLRVAAVLLPNGTGYLLGHDLPTLAADRTYQLWGQTSTGLISLGVLGADPPEVLPFQAGGEIAALAITEEVAGGVNQSANPPALLGRFT